MNDVIATLDAVDALWFREGRPFEAQGAGLADARSLFPPTPATMAGALCAAWAGRGQPNEPKVGDNWAEWLAKTPLNPNDPPLIARVAQAAGLRPPDNVSQIKIAGPFLVGRFVGLPAELLVPCPATIAVVDRSGRDSNEHLSAYQVQGTANSDRKDGSNLNFVVTSKTDKSLANPSKVKPRTNDWIRWTDIRKYMIKHDVIPDVVSGHDLYLDEERIGVALETSRKSPRESQLYAGSVIRLLEDPSAGIGKLESVALAAWLSSDATIPDFATPLPLGGRSGLASGRLNEVSIDLSPPKGFEVTASGGRSRFRLTALTPVPVDPKAEAGLPLEMLYPNPTSLVVQAAIGDRMRAYGWRDRGVPRLAQCFPPGTTWFIEAKKGPGMKRTEAASFWTDTLGGRLTSPAMAALGFGVVIAGTWDT